MMTEYESGDSAHQSAKVEIITDREVPLGGPRAMTVHRTLPQRQRSTIGAWCFVDHYGPDDVSVTGGMDVAPHPHTGLQTASWLFTGEITHHDSADNHAVVKPGELNLMTAGYGICHSEVSTQDTTELHGVQLWIVLPDDVRHTQRHFEHYRPALTTFEGGSALVFLGDLLGDSSPVTTYTPLVGAEIRLEAGADLTMPVNPEFEHGLLVDEGDVELEGVAVQRHELAYTGVGEKVLRVRNTGESAARLLFIGGEPFTEEFVMWWNFIARSSQEIAEMREEWQNEGERFGAVHGYIGKDPAGLSRLPAPRLPGAKLRSRKNPPPVARPEMRIDNPPKGNQMTQSAEHTTTSTTPSQGLSDKQGRAVEIVEDTRRSAFIIRYRDEEKPAGQSAFLDVDKERIFYHTEVGENYEGRGLASILIGEAVRNTQEAGQEIVALCPFVKGWLEKHGEGVPWRLPTIEDIQALQNELGA